MRSQWPEFLLLCWRLSVALIAVAVASSFTTWALMRYGGRYVKTPSARAVAGGRGTRACCLMDFSLRPRTGPAGTNSEAE